MNIDVHGLIETSEVSDRHIDGLHIHQWGSNKQLYSKKMNIKLIRWMWNKNDVNWEDN